MDLITFTTDFGEGSPYIAQMKAAALSINRQLRLFDLTHAIAAQDVRQAALTLCDVAMRFPDDTIHVCVVDPGVGTTRKIIYAHIQNQHFIAPDNGLLSLLAERQRPSKMVSVEATRFQLQPVSATFHGRDIMTPAAAHLTQGVAPTQLGPSLDKMQQLAWPAVEQRAGELLGTVLICDHFGNLITNISRDMLPLEIPNSAVRVKIGDHYCQALVDTYGQARPHTLVALFGSNDRLEIAVTNGSADEVVQGGRDRRVHISWPVSAT